MLLSNHLSGSDELRVDAAAALEDTVLALSRTRALAMQRVNLLINWCFERDIPLPPLSKLGPQIPADVFLHAYLFGRESKQNNDRQDFGPLALFLKEQGLEGEMPPRVVGDHHAIADNALNSSALVSHPHTLHIAP